MTYSEYCEICKEKRNDVWYRIGNCYGCRDCYEKAANWIEMYLYDIEASSKKEEEKE